MGGIEMPRKFRLFPLVLILLCMLMISGCSSDSAKEPSADAQPVQTTGATGPEAASDDSTATSTSGIIRGKVTDGNSNMLIAGIVITDEAGSIVRQTTKALSFANRAAAVTVTRKGAQAAIPTREEVLTK